MTLVKFPNAPASRSFNNFMDDFFATIPSILNDDAFSSRHKNNVPVNIRETAEDYLLEVVAPGFKKEDFRINIENNLLTISAAPAEETEGKDRKYIRQEFKQQAFKRSFTIDEKIDADNIIAKYINGVLTLNLAKKQEVKPPVKEISIQ